MSWLEQLNNKLNVNAKIDKEIMFGVSLKHQTYISVIGMKHSKFVFVQFPQNHDGIAKKLFDVKYPKKLTFKKIKQNSKS